MKTASSPPTFGIAAAQGILSGRAVSRDGETRLAAALRLSAYAPDRDDAELERVAAEIVRCVESRLPGRVRELRVQVVGAHFVLSGACHSYYVKQVAQHLAMNALDAHLLGRLVNEIEVRSIR